MARLTRLAIAGQVHHVALRGHSGAAVFRDDEDRRAFLEMLQTAAHQQRLPLHAYALLETQVHFLGTPPAPDALSRTVQSLGRNYVARFNRRHARSGTLWDGRFRSSVLEARSWLLAGMVYVETLPVVHRLAAQPEDWPWSSAAAHLGLRRDALLSDHPAYWTVGNTPFERERAHADLLARGLSDSKRSAIEAALGRGHALADAAALRELQRTVERPIAPRRRGRPSAR